MNKNKKNMNITPARVDRDARGEGRSTKQETEMTKCLHFVQKKGGKKRGGRGEKGC